MAKDQYCYDQEEEDYIDMDINSTTYMCYTTKEFEFQMSSKNLETDHISTSPADEIFYKGKLLPLHLPPRLQMVETLLRKPDDSFIKNRATANATTTTTTNNTPFASCNISPATSCYVSGELNPDDFFFEEEEEECPKEELIESQTKKSWAKKFKSIKQSSIGLKLKASKAYIQSLFTKSSAPKAKECSKNGYLKKEKKAAEEECGHRRSFSGTVKRRPSNKFSSSSSSCSSSNSSSFSSLKRSSSVNSDKECSIQGAIAYCKKSQQMQALGRKSVSDVEFYLKSEPRIDVECEKKKEVM